MEKLTFINARGDSIEFYSGDYRLKTVTGLGDVDADISGERAPFQDGDTFIDATLQSRYIDLEFAIFGDDYDDIKHKRMTLSRVTNPKLGLGKLVYESGNVYKEIQAIAESVPVFPSGRSNRTETRQIATLSFKCPSPYWEDEEVLAAPTFEPLFQFPFEGEFQFGISREERVIVNDGDAPMALIVEFYGPAFYPTITNETTGEYFTINQELLDGERLIVNTNKNNKTVVFVDEFGNSRNVFNWLDLGSTLFSLDIGENVLTYSAENEIQGAVVNFYYKKRYLSV